MVPKWLGSPLLHIFGSKMFLGYKFLGQNLKIMHFETIFQLIPQV